MIRIFKNIRTHSDNIYIECDGYNIKVPVHSGIGETVYQKQAEDNPLSNCLRSIFLNKDIPYWLVYDPLFLPFNKSGNPFSNVSEEFYSKVIQSNRSQYIYTLDSKSMSRYVGYFYGDNTVIAGMMNKIDINNNIDLVSEWNSSNMVIYLECVDSLYWKVCSKDGATISELRKSCKEFDFR